jgi:hypothetical protein
MLLSGRYLTAVLVTLSGIVAACLSLDVRFMDSNPGKDSGFLRVMKIHSMTSFRGEVKPSVPCGKILRHDKEPYEYERGTL